MRKEKHSETKKMDMSIYLAYDFIPPYLFRVKLGITCLSLACLKHAHFWHKINKAFIVFLKCETSLPEILYYLQP